MGSAEQVADFAALAMRPCACSVESAYRVIIDAQEDADPDPSIVATLLPGVGHVVRVHGRQLEPADAQLAGGVLAQNAYSGRALPVEHQHRQPPLHVLHMAAMQPVRPFQHTVIALSVL